MEQDNLEQFQVGLYARECFEGWNTLLSAQLFRFNGVLSPQFQTIGDLDQATRISQEVHEGGLDWYTLRENEDASVSGGGAFINQEPWKSVKSSIQDFYTKLDAHINDSLPQDFRSFYDDVYADLRSCFRCLIFHGKFDEFHAAIWEAYLQGGWPCGWTGDVFEQDDGSYDVSQCQFCVYWKIPSSTN